MSKQSTVSPIDDLTFDVITVLQHKAKALVAYDKYLNDADVEDDDELHEIFVEMRKQDEEHIQILKEVLARRLEEDLGYEDEDEEEDEDIEDYDVEDEEEVEEPSSTESPRGDDTIVAKPPGTQPRRGESTQRHR